MSTGDDVTPDEWDALLDEDFVRSGPVELSAEERAERTARIRRDHERVAAWRSPGGSATAPRSVGRSRQPRARGPWITAGVLVVVALAWVFRAELQRPGQPTPSAAAEESPAPTPKITRDTAPLGTPPPAPDGAGDYRFTALQDDGSGNPVAFDPCRPLRYVTRTDDAPAGGDRLLRQAVSRVSRATGLQFRFEGTTDEALGTERPLSDPGQYGDGWSPVLIAWSDEREYPDLAGYIAGVGGAQGTNDGVPGSRRFVSGLVVLDAPQLRDLMRRPGGDPQARAVIMHELGHLVGLQHVADRRQLMFSEGGDRTTYGTGDLAGLHALGGGACFVANGP